MFEKSLKCDRCAARVNLPKALEPLVANCAHCGTEVTIPLSLRNARERKLVARRIRERNKAEAEEKKAEEARKQARKQADRAKGLRSSRRANALIGAVVLSTLGGAAWLLYEVAVVDPRNSRMGATEAVERVEALVEMTSEALRARVADSDCTIFQNAEYQHSRTLTDTTMVGGGSCLHVIVSTYEEARLEISTSTGELLKKSGTGLLELEHCASKTGRSSLNVYGEGYARAIAECPHPRHAYKDDATRTGLARVQSELSKLRERGCRKVLLAPKLHFGEISFSGNWRKGRTCPVTVIATGVKENLLHASIKSPLNIELPAPPASDTLQLVTCPESNGTHAFTVSGTTFDFYAMGSVDCPKRLAKSLLKESREQSEAKE